MSRVGFLAALLLVSFHSGCERSSPQPATPQVAAGTEQQTPEEPGVTTEFPVGLSDVEIVDLTHNFDDKTVYWPTADGFRLTVDSFGVSDKGYFYAANSFAAAEHGGTHIDAPIHFYKQRQTVDKIPLTRLIGEAAVVDVSEACRRNRDYQVTAGDLHRWEQTHHRQLVNVILLLRTGFGRFWPDRKRYMGTDERGVEAVAKLRFPGLHPDAARWLVEHRHVKAVGIDSPSIDFGQSSTFDSHVLLFEHNVPVLENVARLDLLPQHGFHVVALPMKIRGGSGGPARIVALVPR